MDKATTLGIGLALLLSGILLTLGYLLHKVRRIHLMMFDVRTLLEQKVPKWLVDHSQQLQILDRLQSELALREPLPPLRGWAASPDFLMEIFTHARAAAPRIIVECSSGASTLVLARAAQMNGQGHVYSLEHDPVFAERTRADLARLGLTGWATVIDAPLQPLEIDGKEWLWYSTADVPEGEIDMVVVDGPPEATGSLARFPAGPVLIPRLGHDGAIFLDDANRDDEREMVRAWYKLFPSLASRSHHCEKGCVSIRINSFEKRLVR